MVTRQQLINDHGFMGNLIYESQQVAAEQKRQADRDRTYPQAETIALGTIRIEAVVTRAGKFLVERLGNSAYPENIGAIRCVGGGPRKGETPRQTLKREFAEEYAIELQDHQIGNELVSGSHRSQQDVRRFRVHILQDLEGRRCLDDLGTELMYADVCPPVCQRRRSATV